jgi:hypothetical protein
VFFVDFFRVLVLSPATWLAVVARGRLETNPCVLDHFDGPGKLKHTFNPVFPKLVFVAEIVSKGQVLPMLSMAKGGPPRVVHGLLLP